MLSDKKKKAVRWTGRALDNLDAAIEYIAQDDPHVAATVGRLIWEAARSLGSHPGKGRPGRVSGTRELILPRLNHILIYSEAGGEVVVLRLLHTAMLWRGI